MIARVGLVLLIVGMAAAGVAWNRQSHDVNANATRRQQIQLADDASTYAASWPPADDGMWRGYSLLFVAVAATGAGLLLVGWRRTD